MEKSHLPERIEADRLYLRKLSLDLAEVMFKYVDEDRERLSQFLPWPKFVTTVQHEIDHINLTIDQWEKFQGYGYGIFKKDDDLYMGNVGIHAISWGWDRCEIGYWILGRYEGKGFMREAVSALTQALHNHGFNRVEIRCDPNNSRSSSIPRALGYQLEGRLHQVVKDGDGNYRDLDIFGHLKNDDEKLSLDPSRTSNDFYTNEELIKKLQSLPRNLRVLVNGYEGGFSEISAVKKIKVKLNANTETYNGPHEDSKDADTDVVVIQRSQ